MARFMGMNDPMKSSRGMTTPPLRRRANEPLLAARRAAMARGKSMQAPELVKQGKTRPDMLVQRHRLRDNLVVVQPSRHPPDRVMSRLVAAPLSFRLGPHRARHSAAATRSRHLARMGNVYYGGQTPPRLTDEEKRTLMPAKSEKQRRFMGAELARRRAGKKTKTGMSEGQLEDYAEGSAKLPEVKKKPHGSGEFSAEDLKRGYKKRVSVDLDRLKREDAEGLNAEPDPGYGKKD